MCLMGSVLIGGTVLALRDGSSTLKIVYIPLISSRTQTLTLFSSLRSFSKERILVVVSEMIPSVLARVSKESPGFLTSAELPSAFDNLG